MQLVHLLPQKHILGEPLRPLALGGECGFCRETVLPPKRETQPVDGPEGDPAQRPRKVRRDSRLLRQLDLRAGPCCANGMRQREQLLPSLSPARKLPRQRSVVTAGMRNCPADPGHGLTSEFAREKPLPGLYPGPLHRQEQNPEGNITHAGFTPRLSPVPVECHGNSRSLLHLLGCCHRCLC